MFFGLGSDDLDMDVVSASEEEALADWEVGEAFFLFVGELEYVAQDVNGASALFE